MSPTIFIQFKYAIPYPDIFCERSHLTLVKLPQIAMHANIPTLDQSSHLTWIKLLPMAMHADIPNNSNTIQICNTLPKCPWPELVRLTSAKLPPQPSHGHACRYPYPQPELFTPNMNKTPSHGHACRYPQQFNHNSNINYNTQIPMARACPPNISNSCMLMSLWPKIGVLIICP